MQNPASDYCSPLAHLGQDSIRLRYKDEDGDFVNISPDDSFAFFLKCCEGEASSFIVSLDNIIHIRAANTNFSSDSLLAVAVMAKIQYPFPITKR